MRNYPLSAYMFSDVIQCRSDSGLIGITQDSFSGSNLPDVPQSEKRGVSVKKDGSSVFS